MKSCIACIVIRIYGTQIWWKDWELHRDGDLSATAQVDTTSRCSNEIGAFATEDALKATQAAVIRTDGTQE